jgi:hypothetical protein
MVLIAQKDNIKDIICHYIWIANSAFCVYCKKKGHTESPFATKRRKMRERRIQEKK